MCTRDTPGQSEVFVQVGAAGQGDVDQQLMPPGSRRRVPHERGLDDGGTDVVDRVGGGGHPEQCLHRQPEHLRFDHGAEVDEVPVAQPPPASGGRQPPRPRRASQVLVGVPAVGQGPENGPPDAAEPHPIPAALDVDRLPLGQGAGLLGVRMPGRHRCTIR